MTWTTDDVPLGSHWVDPKTGRYFEAVGLVTDPMVVLRPLGEDGPSARDLHYVIGSQLFDAWMKVCRLSSTGAFQDRMFSDDSRP